MAKCPKCENQEFKSEIVGVPDKIGIVKCSKCGTAIGVIDYGLSQTVEQILDILLEKFPKAD
jgi:transcription elongation factor Elf1